MAWGFADWFCVDHAVVLKTDGSRVILASSNGPNVLIYPRSLLTVSSNGQPERGSGKLGLVPLPPTARWAISPRCHLFRAVYESARFENFKSWEQVEPSFLAAMSEFDASIPRTIVSNMSDTEKSELSADLQDGKGDFFNDLLALLLENCSGIDLLSTRRKVPGLIVHTHNLDGVYPGTGPIKFMLEAKMMGTPKHINSPTQKKTGRPGSADLDKRVKELPFKCIDLKGESSCLITIEGGSPVAGGAGRGDLTIWLRSIDPRIYFCIAVRVINEADFERTMKWASTAQQVLDAVGVYCFEPVDDTFTTYRRRGGVPADLDLGRVLCKACTDLSAAATPASPYLVAGES